MNGDRYTKVIEEKLVPFMRIHGTNFFLHKSKKVMAVLRRYNKEFSVLDWPGNSTDLNQIENCWSVMKISSRTTRRSLPCPSSSRPSR
jgi:transposase